MRLLDGDVDINRPRFVLPNAVIYSIYKILTWLSFPLSLKLMTAVSVGPFCGCPQVETNIGINNDNMHLL
jgi:hypothetical protein